jgi:hypothetical protein
VWVDGILACNLGWCAYLVSMSTKAQSQVYRLRAVTCEQRAGQVTDRALKREWEELAIEWHLLAKTAHASGDDGQIDVLCRGSGAGN